MPRKSVITEKQIREVYKKVKAGVSLRSLAKEYGVSHQALSKRLRKMAPFYTPTGSKVGAELFRPDGRISSDQLRTAIFVLTGKSSRDTIAIARNKLIGFLNLIKNDGTIL